MTDATQLSPRAGIAVLSLQLRSTVQEAIDAEAAADAIDVDGALWQLRSRLTPLIDERRRALDDEVAQERARAAEAIAAAHAEAERITTAAIEAAAARAMAERAAGELARRAAEQAAIAEQPAEPETLAPPPLFDQAEIWAPGPDDDAEPAQAPVVEEVPTGEVAADEPAPLPPPLPRRPGLVPPRPATDTSVLSGVEPSSDDVWARTVDRSDRTEAPPAMRVTLDADSFARAFAAAMAAHPRSPGAAGAAVRAATRCLHAAAGAAAEAVVLGTRLASRRPAVGARHGDRDHRARRVDRLNP